MSEQNILLGSVGENKNLVLMANTSDDSNQLRKVRICIIDTSTQTIKEEVDVYTSADAIYFDNGLTLPEQLEDLLSYNNMNPVPVTVGGIEKGTKFIGVNWKDIMNKLLYPYQAPTINSFEQDKDPSLFYEKGTDIAPITFNVSVSKGSHSIESVSLIKDGLNIHQFNIGSDGGSDSVSISTKIDVESTFKICIADSNGVKTYSNEFIYRFRDPIYIGLGSLDIQITENSIKAMTKIITDESVENGVTITLNPSDQCIIIAYPSSYIPYSIKDQNGLEIINSFAEKGSVTTAMEDGTYIVYNWIKSDTTTQSNFKLNIKGKKS